MNSKLEFVERAMEIATHLRQLRIPSNSDWDRCMHQFDVVAQQFKTAKTVPKWFVEMLLDITTEFFFLASQFSGNDQKQVIGLAIEFKEHVLEEITGCSYRTYSNVSPLDG